MENNYKKLIETLKHIFQVDRADLDFGIYRILNQKHEEITTFLEKDLLPQVKRELSAYEAGDHDEITRELDEKIASFRKEGFSDEQINANAKIQELRSKLTNAGHTAELENEVFSHLVRFFERYYEEGDFISKRRYKDGVYAIPYEGEEVKLYWANHDQYYIKSSERFKDFSFKVAGKGIHFRIREAETDANNNKNISGKDRRFVLCKEDFWQEDGEALNIYFEYVSVEGKKKQEECSAEAVAVLRSALPQEWLALLMTLAPTEKQANRTVLDKFLTSYTARNTFDYFIHKDLSTFLTRELDFYIKNEVMFLDDIENENAPRADQYLAKVKVIRAIARKLIRMLAQLEDFQKKLWEKKKFVVGTGYCITLDLVPEQYFDAILASDAQRAEWKQLGFIDDTTTLDHEYLRTHPTLSIDTKFFPEWRDELLASFDNLDERVNGVMINSENFGALNLLQERYKEQIKAIYIDPPYNAPGTSEILYKNDFYHSSWLSLMQNRIAVSKNLLIETGVQTTAIDENEQERLSMVLDAIFQGYDRSNVTVIHNPRGVQGKGFSYCNEFSIFTFKHGSHLPLKKLDTSKQKPLMKTGSNSLRSTGQNQFYPIYAKDGVVVRIGNVPGKDVHPIAQVVSLPNGEFEIWPLDTDGNERKWRYVAGSLSPLIDQLEVRPGREVGSMTVYLGKSEQAFKTVWDGPEYNAAEHGSTLLKKMGIINFDFPKSIFTVRDCVDICLQSSKNQTVLDYFAGSGTTGHAVLKLNREDNEKEHGSGQRKYILVEMGAYFDTVTKPRMQKVVYSDEWKDGKPQDNGETGTREHIIKYSKLESYEDTLNNLRLARSKEQQLALDTSNRLREDYVLGYMLDIETKGSVLSLDTFRNPFAYTIELATDVVGETRKTPVDLVETFNYLVGLKVATMRRYGEHLLVVEGRTRGGERTLVIWRNQDVVDSAGLDDFFQKQQLSATDFEYDRIYVNGDNNLENLKTEGAQWKVGLIEEEYHKRMFA